jgi:hypothetical protein
MSQAQEQDPYRLKMANMKHYLNKFMNGAKPRDARLIALTDFLAFLQVELEMLKCEKENLKCDYYEPRLAELEIDFLRTEARVVDYYSARKKIESITEEVRTGKNNWEIKDWKTFFIFTLEEVREKYMEE